MTQETADSLRERIQQLEAELEQARKALAEATRRGHAEPGEDAEWGQFNPG